MSVLVDVELHEFIKNGGMENFTYYNVRSVGYDLRTEYYSTAKDELMEECKLEPNDSVFVGCKEIVSMPPNYLGRIVLRNSRIRQGLLASSPVYHPGHKTQIFFRLTNISHAVIPLGQNDEFCSFMIETLDQPPSETYDGAFQNEVQFLGLSSYSQTLHTLLHKTENFIFLIMPFHETWSNSLWELIKESGTKLNIEVRRADEVYGIKPVIRDIVDLTTKARMIIAITTGGNRNVNYELGIAHAFGKPAIILAETAEDVPFDYRHRRFIVYDSSNPRWGERLVDDVVKTAQALMDDNIKVVNYFVE